MYTNGIIINHHTLKTQLVCPGSLDYLLRVVASSTLVSFPLTKSNLHCAVSQARRQCPKHLRLQSVSCPCQSDPPKRAQLNSHWQKALYASAYTKTYRRQIIASTSTEICKACADITTPVGVNRIVHEELFDPDTYSCFTLAFLSLRIMIAWHGETSSFLD